LRRPAEPMWLLPEHPSQGERGCRSDRSGHAKRRRLRDYG